MTVSAPPSTELSSPLKGFLDRVLLPGVSIILQDGKVRPALYHLNGATETARRRFLVRADTRMRRFGR
jgi:hypothetical protein